MSDRARRYRRTLQFSASRAGARIVDNAVRLLVALMPGVGFWLLNGVIPGEDSADSTT